MTHEYLTLNGKVVYEKIGTGNTAKIMVFTYDAQGRPFAVKYSKNNGESFTNYFYALNLQGDVVKIFRPNAVKDANETIIGYTERTYATYSYNAWGELTGITDSNGNSILNKQTTSTALANLNPLRYRGYYYDNETGFYYLQSRYYDPANRRFINADFYASTGKGFLGNNMFSYCNNCPVTHGDSLGTYPVSLLLDENDYVNEKDPPGEETGYVPPKNGKPRKVRNPNGSGKGWEAKDGGVWVPNNRQHGGAGWTVQYPGGKHEHHYPGGHVRKSESIDIQPPQIEVFPPDGDYNTYIMETQTTYSPKWYDYVFSAGGGLLGIVLIADNIYGFDQDDVYAGQLFNYFCSTWGLS